jgi:hypothetical protein
VKNRPLPQVFSSSAQRIKTQAPDDDLTQGVDHIVGPFRVKGLIPTNLNIIYDLYLDAHETLRQTNNNHH